MRAKEFADSIGAKLTMPSRPLLERKDAAGYFTHTDVRATFERFAEKPKAAKVSQLKRRK